MCKLGLTLNVSLRFQVLALSPDVERFSPSSLFPALVRTSGDDGDGSSRQASKDGGERVQGNDDDDDCDGVVAAAVFAG